MMKVTLVPSNHMGRAAGLDNTFLFSLQFKTLEDVSVVNHSSGSCNNMKVQAWL